jgi:phage terminase large subunit-like protein
MRTYEFPPEVQGWIDIVEKNIYETCKEQKLLVKYVKKCFQEEDIYIDLEQLDKYMNLAEKYLPFPLFEWEKFVITLHDCTYWIENKMPRWPDLFCLIGRGAGKDGMIAFETFCLSSPYNGIKEYDVDICANNEEQAIRPVQDLTNWFEEPRITRKIKKFYHWTKQKITCTKTKSVIKGRTNNPKGKDGLRSGIVIFNEIHQYENYDNIDVFTTGLGKKKHPRRSYYTTDGEVREGPLDDLKRDGEEILNTQENDNGLLPFICKLDSEEEVDNEDNWPKANPSIPYLPDLLMEIRKEYRDWKKNPERISSFMSRRMDSPKTFKESAAVPWEQIEKTNREMIDLERKQCVIGIDYAKTSDWVSVNAHFKVGNIRYDINHSWICSNSKDLHRIKAPWRDWVDKGMATYVEAAEIAPELIADYIYNIGRQYTIKMVCIDNYRYTLMKEALKKVGFSIEKKNLYLVSQMDILKIVPVIDHIFASELVVWGDHPVLRWATNNTKTIRYGRQQGADKGSFVYAKIEARSRKTDPFMAFVASVIKEEEIKQYIPLDEDSIISF